MDPNLATQAKRAPTWPLMVLTFAVVLLPAIARGIRPEIGRWHLAMAQDLLTDTVYFRLRSQHATNPKAKEEDANASKESLAKAEESVERSAKWGGKTAEYFSIRASIHGAKGDGDGLMSDLLTAARKSSPQKSWQRWETIGNVEYNRGRFKEAIGHYLHSLELAEARDLYEERSGLLNQLAYTRAVASIDLPAALTNIDEAIEIHESSVGDVPTQVDSTLVQLRDTRGFILYKMGKRKEAREEFDLIWEDFEDWFEEQQQMLAEVKKQRIDIRQWPSQHTRVFRSVSVIIYHRMLVLDPLNEADDIQKFRLRIEKYGHPPGPNLY